MDNRRNLKAKSARWHSIYSVISTIIETALLAVILIWVLPLFGVILPLWGLILFLTAFLAISYIMYRISHPTVTMMSFNDPESIIGSEGVVESDLMPEGFVRVRGELWKATCINGMVTKGTEITVTHINNMTLTVAQKL